MTTDEQPGEVSTCLSSYRELAEDEEDEPEFTEDETTWFAELDEAEEVEEETPFSENIRFMVPPGVLVCCTTLLPGAVRRTVRLPASVPLRISHSSSWPFSS